MAVAAILPAVSLFAAGPRDEKPFIVTAEEYSKTPLSPLLYGNFIELGYGRQVEAMYSEMLFNRSFEHFLPYRDINKSWYDLYFDESDHEKGYEKDWSVFDWYHSGYEHNSWYAAQGDPGKGSVIFDEETFFHGLTPSEGGSGHGKQCLTVSNEEDSERLALAQDGKFLVRGKSYSFSGMFKSEGSPLTPSSGSTSKGNGTIRSPLSRLRTSTPSFPGRNSCSRTLLLTATPPSACGSLRRVP